jgi:hypothetical protein
MVEDYRRFRGASCLRHQGDDSWSKTKKKGKQKMNIQNMKRKSETKIPDPKCEQKKK